MDKYILPVKLSGNNFTKLGEALGEYELSKEQIKQTWPQRRSGVAVGLNMSIIRSLTVDMKSYKEKFEKIAKEVGCVEKRAARKKSKRRRKSKKKSKGRMRK